jgi:transglutaminase-like putative cysteine protease
LKPPPALWIALCALVADGVWALHVADFLGPPGLAAAAGLGILTWWARGLPAGIVRMLDGSLVPIAAVVSAADVALLADTVLDGLVRLLLFLVFYKLATVRTVRDTRPVTFLAFFMLVAAASSAFGLGFLFVFVAFVVLATWVILVQHVLLEAEGATLSATADRRDRTRELAGVAAVAALGVIVVTAGLFFVLPRLSLAALPLRARLGAMVTGFSDRVELGTFGRIATDDTVVMRVHIPEAPGPAASPDGLPDLRWRGLALDGFDGTAWTLRHPRKVRVARTGGGGLVLDRARHPETVLTQEFFLEPLSTGVVFAAPRLVELRGLGGPVTVDDMGAVAVSPLLARLTYTVESEIDGGPIGNGLPGRVVEPLDDLARARFLELPALPPRVATLARDLTAGSRDPADAAQRLVRFLTREFRYTLAIERLTALDPLEEFLLVRRTGHCEYFAGSLAAMLRSVGIPARVVNGFLRGEWNPYGRYFIVRRRDAHSWVEAYLDGRGWTTLDPSPRAQVAEEVVPSPTFLVLDALRLRWHRYVVNWSVRDQLSAARAVRNRVTAWGPWLSALRERRVEPGAAWLLIAAALVGAVTWYRWPARWPGAASGTARLPRSYARALAILRRRGLRPAPHETAREFSRRVAELRPGSAEPLGVLTRAYEEERFATARLDPSRLAQLDDCLAALDRAARGQRPS